MPTLITKRYEQILQQMINNIVARTSLNDVVDTSVFKHLLAATARELDEAYYQMARVPDMFSVDTAVGEDLDARAAEVQPDGISRVLAVKSTGQVQFSRNGTSGTVTVPAGTRVSTAAEQVFVTTVAVTINNGDQDSALATAVAAVAGAAGNVAAGTITRFENRPAGVDTVTNPATFVGGLDVESDDSLRRRIKAHIRSLPRSTPQALEFAAVGITVSNGQRVAFAHVVEDALNRGEVTLYIDDGSGTAETTEVVSAENLAEGLGGPLNSGNSCVGGEVFLYTNFSPIKPGTFGTLTSSVNGALVLGTDFLLDPTMGQVKLIGALYASSGAAAGEFFTVASYTRFTGLIQEVQKVINGDPNDRTAYPGWRAAGVRVAVLPPVVLQQVVTASVLVAEGYSKPDVLDECSDAISAYINGLGVSGDVIRAELITRIMEVAGVVNVTVTSPSTDVILLDEQLPRVNSGNISLS